MENTDEKIKLLFENKTFRNELANFILKHLVVKGGGERPDGYGGYEDVECDIRIEDV